METEPKEPYIYQPYGMQDREHWLSDRVFGIGGLSMLTTIKGLTRIEAEVLLETIKNTTAFREKPNDQRD